MKHLNTFEYVVYMRDLNVGDWVLIDENTNSYDLTSPEWIFINSTVGKIVEIAAEKSRAVKIEYENIPYNIKRYFRDEKFIIMTTSKIKYHDKTKEGVEAMIASEKYNL